MAAILHALIGPDLLHVNNIKHCDIIAKPGIIVGTLEAEITVRGACSLTTVIKDYGGKECAVDSVIVDITVDFGEQMTVTWALSPKNKSDLWWECPINSRLRNGIVNLDNITL